MLGYYFKCSIIKKSIFVSNLTLSMYTFYTPSKLDAHNRDIISLFMVVSIVFACLIYFSDLITQEIHDGIRFIKAKAMTNEVTAASTKPSLVCPDHSRSSHCGSSKPQVDKSLNLPQMFQGFQLPLSSAKSTYGKLKDQPSALYSDNQSIHTC